MKKLTILTIAVMALLTVGYSCNFSSGKSGGPETKVTRDVKDFSRISLSVPAEVYIEQGAAFSFSMEGPENTLSEIETVVDGSTLKIRWKNRGFHWSGNENIKIYITAPDYQALTVAGSGDFYTKSPLKCSSLELSIAGSGSVTIDQLEANSLTSEIAGSGDVEIKAGKVGDQEASINGSGSVKTAGVETANGKVSIAGSGDCDIWVTGDLKASIAGSGDVRYKGNPKLNIKVAGSGDIEQIK